MQPFLDSLEATPDVRCKGVSALTSSLGRGLEINVARGYGGALITSWTSISTGSSLRPGVGCRALLGVSVLVFRLDMQKKNWRWQQRMRASLRRRLALRASGTAVRRRTPGEGN